MASSSILDVCSIALALGGGLATLGWLLFALLDPGHQHPEHPRWLPLNGLLIAAGVLMAMGLPGFYFRQAEQAGALGTAAFVILFIGLVIPYIAVQSIETASAPEIPRVMRRWVAVGAPAIWLGSILMGIVTIRAGVYPGGAGVYLIIGVLFGMLTLAPRPVPRWLARNAASIVYTTAICYLGILSLSF